MMKEKSVKKEVKAPKKNIKEKKAAKRAKQEEKAHRFTTE